MRRTDRRGAVLDGASMASNKPATVSSVIEMKSGNTSAPSVRATVVHSVGGWAALSGVILLGPRLGKYLPNTDARPVPAHNVASATFARTITQSIGIGAVGALTFSATLLVWTVLRATIGIRVSSDRHNCRRRADIHTQTSIGQAPRARRGKPSADIRRDARERRRLAGRAMRTIPSHKSSRTTKSSILASERRRPLRPDRTR